MLSDLSAEMLALHAFLALSALILLTLLTTRLVALRGLRRPGPARLSSGICGDGREGGQCGRQQQGFRKLAHVSLHLVESR
jgi:hypothetical protein